MTETAGYSGTPLPKKLGVKPDSTVLLVSAPKDFALAPLPPGATVHRRDRVTAYDVIVVFCPDLATLTRRFSPLAGRLTRAGALWVAWPKKASGVPTDLSDNVVREFGLAAGLVDTKIAAIDATWSGQKFVVRLRDR